MKLKTFLYAVQDENSKGIDSTKDYPTIADLMKEQNVSHNDTSTVHFRRDLDSLG